MQTSKYRSRNVATGNKEDDAYPLLSSKDLDPLLERIGDAHVVLLGEASHGTHEYYTWRTAITKRLIEEKGFNFIGVEGDWPDCYKINRFIKGYSNKDDDITGILKTFNRWPTWMWANWEIAALGNWLKEYNTHLTGEKKVGFYGLDVYSLWESMEVMVNYLEKTDPAAAKLAREAIYCFEANGGDEQDYARKAWALPETCRKPVVDLLREIRQKADTYDDDPEASLNMEQNAHIAVNAEEYYSHMIGFNDLTWNMRDTHMMSTLKRIRRFYGKKARAIVWEHNTHIGDARFTNMHKAGMINVGQLVRQDYGGEDTVLVGFGSYRGTVIAGEKWGATMQEMDLPEARENSIESSLHDESDHNRLFIFDRDHSDERFRIVMPHRAVGVVYDPIREKYGNYVPSVMSERYDAFIYLDETSALHPLHVHPDHYKVPETYPFDF